MGWFLSRAALPPRTCVASATCCSSPSCAGSTASTSWCRSCSRSACCCSGMALERYAPQLGTTGGQLLVWGFVVSTVAALSRHLHHQLARARVRARAATPTGDDSRNNWLLALITLGEGWHNNHHHYPSAARQGFYWWEIDVTYYLLRVLAAARHRLGPAPVPARVRDVARARRRDENRRRRLGYRRPVRRLAPAPASHDVTVFEAADYARRPHAHRRRRLATARRCAIDTGFIVFNDWTYPQLHRAAATSSASRGSRRT